MAEILTDEALDYIMAIFPKNGSNIAALYIGLFTSQTASTVPARDATGGGSPAGWTEASGTSYARQSLAAATWGAQATDGTGRQSTYPQITMPTVGSGGWGTANGFFISTHVSSQAGDTPIIFANFDDVTAVTLNENDIIKITPTLKFEG